MVVLIQVWRQTVLGWLLLLSGFTVVAIGLSYWTVEERLMDPWPLTLLATVIAICIGLVLNRPALSR